MIAVVQRVKSASVTVEGRVVGQCGRGYAILLGVAVGDTEKDAEVRATKLSKLRIFEDENQKMNLNLTQVDGEIMIVPNFTLYADCSHGFRPSFINALKPDEATKLFDKIIEKFKAVLGDRVKTGVFGADMQISQHNDGPITIVIDSNQI